MNSHRSGQARRPKSTYGLRLEELENRWCPSCTVLVDGTTLRISGDSGNNTASIVDNGAAGIVVTCDGTTSPAATGITRIELETGKGNDTVTYSRSAAGGNFTTALEVKAELGQGNDAFTANFNGNDVVGTSRVQFDVEGGKGTDSITINAGTATAAVDIAVGARLDLNLEGGPDNDTIAVNYQGELDGRLTLRAEGGPGIDRMTANFVLNTGSTGSLDAKLEGGPANDILTLNITGPGGTTAVILAVIEGGSGTDACTYTPNVTVESCP